MIFSKKNLRVEIVIIFLLLAPLFFINVKSQHDWGDDFAGYIHQTKNILHHTPPDETGYITNPANPQCAPLYYPSGFPLLLAPVILIFGESIHVLLSYISFFLVGFGLFSFLFFRKYFSFATSIFATLIIFYNPFLLDFKAQILSDIPFGFLFFACILLYVKQKSSWWKFILLGLLSGFLLNIRVVGASFIIAVIANEIAASIRKHGWKKFFVERTTRIQLLGYCICVFVIHLLLNKILFPATGNGLSTYNNFYAHQVVLYNLLDSFQSYMGAFQDFFKPDNGRWNFLVLISSSFMLTFFLLGFFNKILKRFGFIEWVLLFYLSSIFFYPYHASPLRFLIPVIPLLIYYAIEGFKNFQLNIKIRPFYLVIIIGVFVLNQYRDGISKIITEQNNIVIGPQSPDGESLINFIKTATPPDAIICFGMPRTLCLYTNRKSFSQSGNPDAGVMDKNFKQMKTDYLIYFPHDWSWDLRDKFMVNYVSTYRSQMDSVWSNENFVVFKFRKQE